jgi:hypothetical protein
LQQIQIESCQPIKGLKDKKKIKLNTKYFLTQSTIKVNETGIQTAHKKSSKRQKWRLRYQQNSKNLIALVACVNVTGANFSKLVVTFPVKKIIAYGSSNAGYSLGLTPT